MCTGADFSQKGEGERWGSIIREEVRRKEGKCKGQREQEQRGQQHFLHVDPCSQQFSQVSERLFTLVRDLPGIPSVNPVL